MCRETGITFCGPLALGIFSLSCGDADTRCAAFEEAEAALAGGCVSHNYFWFYRVGAGYTVRLGDTRYRTGAGRGLNQQPTGHANATHSISISNSIGQDDMATNVRAGGSCGK